MKDKNMFCNSLIKTCALLVLVSPIARIQASETAWKEPFEKEKTEAMQEAQAEQAENTRWHRINAMAGVAGTSLAYSEELGAQENLQRLQKIQASRTLRSKLSDNGIRIVKDYNYLYRRFFVPLQKYSQGSRTVKWCGLGWAALHGLGWQEDKKKIDDDLERKLQRIDLDIKRSSQRN
jgi:hypothetical protein